MNSGESALEDLFINDPFYRTGFDTARIPYEVLSGIRSLKPEDEEIRDWLWAEKKIRIEYVHRGNCICVEHGHYLEGIILYITREVALPKNTLKLRRALYERFKFEELNSEDHREWEIKPEHAIFFYILEDELKNKVDDFIYYIMKEKAHGLGAGLEFTCLDFVKHRNMVYEYRVCYQNKEELDRRNGDGSNEALKKKLEELIMMNNYSGIYDDMSPGVRFIVDE